MLASPTRWDLAPTGLAAALRAVGWPELPLRGRAASRIVLARGFSHSGPSEGDP